MKKLILLTLCALLARFASAAGPTFGQHGMVLFGGSEALYASHLPMFHAPHDYQVIFRLRLNDARLDAQLRRALASRVALWTLAPESFELDRLSPDSAAPLTSFKADIVEGHFEQGGRTRHAGIAVVVEQVLVFRRLAASPAHNALSRYTQIGSGKARFLVKQIDSRPDFDHIVAIRTRGNTPIGPLALAKRTLARPSTSSLASILPGARIRGTVYFSTEDLK